MTDDSVDDVETEGGERSGKVRAGRAESPIGAKDAPFSLRTHVLGASAVMVGLLVGVGGWAANARISGAVIAPGTFVVERNVKKVQHSYGGIVSEINVKNGDRVAAGDVLMRFDATQISAELGVVKSQIVELTARSIRLAAERDGKMSVEMPADLLTSSADAKAAAEGEKRLFDEARTARESQKEQLALKIKQSEQEIVGLTGQLEAKANEIKIISKELEALKSLQEKKLSPATRVYAMEREAVKLRGEHGGLTAQIARVGSQISEIKVQILSIDENFRAQAQRDLRGVEAKLAELSERLTATTDKFRRIDIRAPKSGTVHELAVHTVGGVVSPAEQIMLIVPDSEALTVQARIAPNDIDQVVVGRPARLVLTAFAKEKSPELFGHVIDVSADVVNDPKTGQSHYVARLEIDQSTRNVKEEFKLVPGMPAEVYIATGERTALSYLAKPLKDQFNRAFRE